MDGYTALPRILFSSTILFHWSLSPTLYHLKSNSYRQEKLIPQDEGKYVREINVDWSLIYNAYNIANRATEPPRAGVQTQWWPNKTKSFQKYTRRKSTHTSCTVHLSWIYSNFLERKEWEQKGKREIKRNQMKIIFQKRINSTEIGPGRTWLQSCGWTSSSAFVRFRRARHIFKG